MFDLPQSLDKGPDPAPRVLGTLRGQDVRATLLAVGALRDPVRKNDDAIAGAAAA